MANLFLFYYVKMFLQTLRNYLTLFESKSYEYIHASILRKVRSSVCKGATRGCSEITESKSIFFGY